MSDKHVVAALQRTVADLELRLREVVRERDEAYDDRKRARAERDEARAEVERLRGQLPEGMEHCTIRVRECRNGYNDLLAAYSASVSEADRLRKLFDDAGQGEYNVLALIDHYQRNSMEADERIRAVRKLLEENGCDCPCDHHPDERGDDCEVARERDEAYADRARARADRDEARAELLSATQQLELEREAGAQLRAELGERMRETAEAQREACAEAIRPSNVALAYYEAADIVRAASLVTDTKADGGTP